MSDILSSSFLTFLFYITNYVLSSISLSHLFFDIKVDISLNYHYNYNKRGTEVQHYGRNEHYAKKQYLMNISNHLCSLIKQAENYYRSNRFGSLKKVEGILCGLLNLLNGWNLIPIDDDDEKMSIFCQINQMDQDQHIALEIIYDNALSKLNSSLSRFPNHWTDMSYHALIVSNEKLPDSVGALPNKSWFSYKSNVWTASKVQSILQNNFAVDFIGNISDYLDEAVRLISKPFKSHVPLLPSLPLHGASFLPRTRVAELKVLKKHLYINPLFFCGDQQVLVRPNWLFS